MVDDAQGAEIVTVGRGDGDARIETNVGISGDQRIGGEAFVLAGIGNLKQLRLLNGVGTERDRTRSLGQIEADAGFKPLPILVDQGNQRDGCIADEGSETGEVVVRILGR